MSTSPLGIGVFAYILFGHAKDDVSKKYGYTRPSHIGMVINTVVLLILMLLVIWSTGTLVDLGLGYSTINFLVFILASTVEVTASSNSAYLLSDYINTIRAPQDSENLL